MKKVMAILLAFIMVLQLVPITAFATEEIATAEDLKAFLENPENVTVAEGSTLTVQISAESRFTKVAVYCAGEVRIKTDVTIPSGVKLQIPNTTKNLHVDSTITVEGCIQDGRTVADRTNGIVGEGNGAVIFVNGSAYFQQAVTMIDTSNAKLKLVDDTSTITMYKNGHMEISSGTVNLNSALTTDHFLKITVAEGATFVDGGYVDTGIAFGDEVQETEPSEPEETTEPSEPEEEMTAAEELKAFMENPDNVTVAEGSTLTVQISTENRFTKVSMFCDGEVRIKKDVTIPSDVKLQIPAATKYFHVDSTITVLGCIQDGRAVADRTNGIVGEGDGKVIFTNGSVYFQQGVTMIDTSNTKLKLADDDSTITMYKNGHMEISSGTVNLNSALTTDHFKKITVAEDAIFNDGGYVDAGIEFTTVSNHGGDLDAHIEKAENLLAFISVSSDGSDIDSDSLWVTQDVHDTYSAAIAAAQTAAETGGDDAIIAAIEALQEATFRFHAEKEQGGVDVGTQTTYQELLDALNAIQDGCATYKGEEDYGDQHYEVIQITKPITIDQVITVPYPIKLQFNADITINGRIIVEGYLQDLYLSAYGIFGKEGVGDVLFNPNTWMYIKGKGGVVGTTSGTWVKDGAEMLLVGDHGMIITEGEVEVVTALYSDIAEQVYCMENTGITLSSGINESASIDASNVGVTFVYRGIENTKNILGGEAVSVSCSSNAVSAVLEDGRIVITLNDKVNAGNVEIIFTDVNGGSGTVEIAYAKGAITYAKVTQIGSMTTNQAKERIATLKAELQSLMNEAQSNGLDTQREEAVLWFAQYFEKCADWDEANMTIVKNQFNQSAVYGYNADALAEQLPMYERMQVIEMLEDAISELQDVIDGKIVRPDVVKVDWDNLTIQGDQVYNPDGTPVFLYDYFSKAQNGDQNDGELYNDYLGNIVHPISQSLQYLTEDGNLSNNALAQNINFYDYYSIEENVGYQFLWHSGTVLPAWVSNLYGDEITIGGENYTVYDIDNPNVRKMWEQIFEMLIPQIEDSKTTQLGYILANEPHWFTDSSASFNVTGISQHTSAKFEEWLAETYVTVEALNANWGTEYTSFDEVNMQVPTDLESLRGTPKYYDWCRFNMDRVNDWFQFLHDGITEFDEDAATHIKIFPRIVVDENGQRDHGIDIEYLTSLTEYNGNDVTVRKRLPKATSDEWWEEDYIYDWRELAMTYAMLDSFNPDTLNVNSESHFLNGNAYADMYTTTQYTRSVYWLSAMLGNNVNMTWWWPRYGDGSIEPRLQTTQMGKTFAGSAATMPLVANEITQTFFDLNSVSDTIVKFQRQDMPIRVLYSETACIVDADQINRTFEMFEALYFEGTSIGFASENVINLYGDTFSQILIYNTPCVTDEEFAALQSFLDNGGTIIMDDVSLTMNQYKAERAETLEAGNGTLVVMQDGTVEDMSAKAFEMLDEEQKTDVILSESNNSGTKTCIWRAADGESADERVISIVNVGQGTSTLTLNGYDIENMLTGEKLENSFAIESEGVLLLRFSLGEDTTDDVENSEVSDQEAADAVDAMIETIGTVTHESVSAIEDAREAYDALTEEQKALVKNYQLLCAAEEELAALQQGQNMYYAWLEANEPDVAVGESVALHVEVRGTGYTDYASSEIVISYDNTVLTFDEFGSNLYGATVVDNDGTLTLEDFGETQSFGTGYVISFVANAEGEGTVTLTSAAFSTQANAANSDLISAVLQDTTVTIVATLYHSVDLPDIFIGADSVSSGEDYTFAPADLENYDYSDVTATMDGEPVEVTKNDDGSYTVENVTGDLVISGSRTAKKYVVTITGITASNDGTLATYGMDYKFSLPENVAAGLENGKAYTLASITVGGKNYTNYKVDGRNYTILGGDINGDVVITINETSLSPTQYAVSVEGDGAGAAAGYEAVAEANKPYTLTIVPVAGYDYTVTATMGGERIELTVSENSYTTPNVTGDLVFTIDEVVNTEGVEIGEYLKLDETIVWLVTMEVVKLDDQVYTYGGNAMLWSEKYGAYCYLVISVEKPEIDADDFALIAGAAENVDYGMDVNKSGKVDANDAQLTYNMYNAMYSAFSDEINIEKFLRTDVTGDRTVNVRDARMIIDEILR